jgi:hypothetical protein
MANNKTSHTSNNAPLLAVVHIPPHTITPSHDHQVEKRSQYIMYVSKVFQLLAPELSVLGGDGSLDYTDYSTPVGSRRAAERVLALETDLAAAHLTRTEMRDPEKTYNMMTPEDLAIKCRSAGSPSAGSPASWASYLTRGTAPVPAVDFGRFLRLVGVAEDSCALFNVASVSGVVKAGTLAHTLSDGTSARRAFVDYLLFTVANR